MNFNNFENLLDLFFFKYQSQEKRDIFLQSLSDRKSSFSWEETFLSIKKFSDLIKKNSSKGQRCLLISENRPEWFIADLSIMLSELITVPTYTTYSEKDYEYIIEDCEPSIVVVSNQIQYDKIKNIIKQKSLNLTIFSFEKLNINIDEYTNLNHLFFDLDKVDKSIPKINIKRKDPACIIYTSGTQGNPKGVILSHGGILNNCEGAFDLLKPITAKRTRFLTWLPLSHSYEHTVQFVQVSIAAKIFYSESIDKLIKNMNECKPQIMTAVPRFYQNLYQKINASFAKTQGFKKILINKMLDLGIKKIRGIKLSFIEIIIDIFLEYLVRNKIKNQFGGNLKTFVSGGGALDKDVGEFLNAIGLPTLQGYGLTEASPVISCNPINAIRVETVGIPFKGVEVKIAEDGEILVKGENVMLGYWKKKEETEEVIKNKWLHTGDIGYFSDGYLKITDRKKDIIITPGGDNISPVKIENEIINSNKIDQAIVFGDNKPYLSALLVLNENYSLSKDEIQKEIENINKNLSKVENIKKFFVVNEKFTIENGMLTPTLKLKRYKIIKKYINNFKKLY
ncbi:MAG: AMP-dependent synthetase/ligase [Candidatus Pelagibacter sp.]